MTLCSGVWEATRVWVEVAVRQCMVSGVVVSGIRGVQRIKEVVIRGVWKIQRLKRLHWKLLVR